MKVVAPAILLSFLLLHTVAFQIPKIIYQDGANGSKAVLLSVSEIQQSGVFGEDDDLLRRIAFVETKDGTIGDTFRDGYSGGIWAVDEKKFSVTQNIKGFSRLPAKLQQIGRTLNINWLKVRWSDLRRPLFGAIAARLVLFLASDPIPPATDLVGQAQFWVEHYNRNGTVSEFLTRSTGLEGSILESAANEFFLGFSRSLIQPILQLFVTTPELHPVAFNVTAIGFAYNGVATSNTSINVTLPSSLEVRINDLSDRYKGIHVKAEGESKIVVYGISYAQFTTDAFLALPCNNLPVDEYEYYGITYPLSPSSLTSDILIVGCEENTLVTTPNNSFTVNKLETHLISSADSTGLRIIATKPISLFSNHECTNIPTNVGFCDWLSEQIPPTVTWGQSFFMASLLGRNSGELVRILASKNFTTVTVNCTTFTSQVVHNLSASGSWTEFEIPSLSFCNIESSGPVLVMQFSQGNQLDGVGDPFMMMITPVEQYSNSYVLTVLPEFSTNYITVYVATEYYQPQRIFVDSTSLITSLWTTVYCTNGLLCGYITRMSLPAGEHSLHHQNTEARVGVSAYGFNQDNSYGYPGGLKLTPVQLATVSFDSRNYIVLEAEGSLQINITRSGNTATLSVVLVATDNFQGTASVKEDYSSISTLVEFLPGETRKEIAVKIYNDKRIERNETFELYLIAGEGVHLSPFPRAQVIIENDDGAINLNPSYGSMLGGSGLLVSGDRLHLEVQDNISCIFDGISVVGIYVSELQALCISPTLERMGQLEFRLSVRGSITFSGETSFTSLNYAKAFEIYLENDNLLFSGGSVVRVHWSPVSVFPLELPNSYTVDIDMLQMNANGVANTFSLVKDIPNTGLADVSIPSIDATASLEGPVSPVIVQVSLSDKVLSRSRSKRAISLILRSLRFLGKKPVVSSAVRYLINVAPLILCEAWSLEEPVGIGEEILNRLPPCPRRIQDIRIPNSGFTEEKASSHLPVIGPVGNIDLPVVGRIGDYIGYTVIDDKFREFFHPGTSSCFRQRVTDPTLTGGSGQQCCYDNNGFLVVGPPGGGTVDKVSPDVDFAAHFWCDVYPYLLCCKAGTQCDNYYKHRPSDRGIDFSPPPPPAIMRGDPHIATLDGYQYTFNGKGEFVLINTADDSFFLQARMVPIDNVVDNSIQATVFTAIVVRQNNSGTVQFEIVNNETITLINGEEVDFMFIKEYEFANVSINDLGKSTYSASFSSGAYLEVKQENGIFSSLVVSLPKIFRVAGTSGLMGSFNGNQSDDLLPNSADVPLSLNSSLRDIHQLFGITWIIDTPFNSLFTYQPGEHWATYYDPFFMPVYSVVFSSAELEQEATELCGKDKQCLFDVAATGRLDIGLSTLTSGNMLNEIIQLQIPVICNTPCGNGVCVANDTCNCASGYGGEYCTEPDSGVRVNDTVIGDPLYTVPMRVPQDQLDALNLDKLSLCYEIHGKSEQWFNLVTDDCVSVNTRYAMLSPRLNIMDAIAVRAVDEVNQCVNIRVDVAECTAMVGSNSLNVISKYESNGIMVKRYRNRVRISVPNCQDLTLVMWVICENHTLENPDSPGSMLTSKMIKFVVMRGLNFGHRQAHGLLGQFWNIPVSIAPYTGLLSNGDPAVSRYVVNITTSGVTRSYTGLMHATTWDNSGGPCLFVGNSQSGPIVEVRDPNDPVIESLYKNYEVKEPFSEDEDYKFRMFNESRCIAGPTME